jgi:hypothetical protein
VDIAFAEALVTLQTHTFREGIRCIRMVSPGNLQDFVKETVTAILNMEVTRRIRQAGIKCNIVVTPPNSVSPMHPDYINEPIIYKTANQARDMWQRNQVRIQQGKLGNRGLAVTDERDRTVLSKLVDINGGQVVATIDIHTAVAPETTANFWKVCEAALSNPTLSDLSVVQHRLALNGITTTQDALTYLGNLSP